MTTIKTFLNKQPGCYLVSEANRTRSRGVGTLAADQTCVAGTVLALNTSTREYEPYDNDGTTLTRTAAAILFSNEDTTDGNTKQVTLTLRDCEVNADELTFESSEDTGDKEAAYADLAVLGIIVRFETRVT